MITYEEALALFSRIPSIKEVTTVPLKKSLGCVLAKDLLAPCSLPLFNNSAMDGVALRLSDLRSEIRIAGTRLAQRVKDSLDHPRTKAIRIMTGAKVPSWAELVVPIEKIEGIKENVIRVAAGLFNKGENIRFSGEDYQKGELIFKKGHFLNAEALMVLANFGIQKVEVFKKPALWLLTTGNEVKRVGSKLFDGEIYNSSQIYLKTKIRELELPLKKYIHMKDQKEKLKSFLKTWLKSKGPSLLVTTGAVSMGDKDDFPKLAQELGLHLYFHKVAIRPGKPVLFCSDEKDHYWIGAPGNAIATAVAWTFFVRPFLHSWGKFPLPHTTQVTLAEDFKKPLGIKTFFRGYCDGEKVILAKDQGSQRMKASATSNVFVELRQDQEVVIQGSKVTCTWLC